MSVDAPAVQKHAVHAAARPEVNHELGELVPELGTFILPGRVKDPAAGLTEATDAERAGLGKVWLSERYNLKDIGVISGAVAALTQRIGFASGLVAARARHPLVTAAARRLPKSWIEPNAAIGGPAECAAQLRAFIGLGVDEICLHGASPAELTPVVDAWRTAPKAQ
jgi:alkanesulfonate monooxygenase SsuD/methylene tetrahydromethanopterin reductase-like flavin-dependent oxidoreductase (luciferase family)